MSAEHLQQSIKGDFRGALQHLEEVADHIRSAQKTFEALPSTSDNSAMDAICDTIECPECLAEFTVDCECPICKGHWLRRKQHQ